MSRLSSFERAREREREGDSRPSNRTLLEELSLFPLTDLIRSSPKLVVSFSIQWMCIKISIEQVTSQVKWNDISDKSWQRSMHTKNDEENNILKFKPRREVKRYTKTNIKQNTDWNVTIAFIVKGCTNCCSCHSH